MTEGRPGDLHHCAGSGFTNLQQQLETERKDNSEFYKQFTNTQIPIRIFYFGEDKRLLKTSMLFIIRTVVLEH